MAILMKLNGSNGFKIHPISLSNLLQVLPMQARGKEPQRSEKGQIGVSSGCVYVGRSGVVIMFDRNTYEPCGRGIDQYIIVCTIPSSLYQYTQTLMNANGRFCIHVFHSPGVYVSKANTSIICE